MQYVAVKYDLELAKKDAKFIKQYPLMAKRIQELEQRPTSPAALMDLMVTNH